MEGRKPIPKKLKVLMGNPGKRKLGNEPTPAGKIPKCPDHLPDEGKKEWRRVCKELAACKLLTALDRAALAAYCQAWARWLEAEDSLRQSGVIIMSPKKYPIQNPYLAVANKAMQQMKEFLVEFGMTPSSRSRISVESADAGNEFDQWKQSAAATRTG